MHKPATTTTAPWKQGIHQLANKSMLKTHTASGTSLKGTKVAQQSTGTLKTIKSLKDKLS